MAALTLHPEALKSLVDATGLTPLMVSMLWARGVVDADAMLSACDPQRYVETPANELPDYQPALDRIAEAVRGQQSIAIWGDFDVDGLTSTAILLSVLRAAGAVVRFKIPSRLEEGHGISADGAELLVREGVEVIITVDTGITAFEACDRLTSLGVDVVITDHHALGDRLPSAHAVVNPMRLSPGHPLYTLSGAGVAYKLAQGLCERLGLQHLLPDLLGLCAVGLIADVVPLIADTRWLVQTGLEVLRSSSAPWLQALAGVARFTPSLMDEEDVAFRIAPRLNALGRLGDATTGVDFLTETDPAHAAAMAREIDSLNTKRQFLTQQLLVGAQQQIATRPDLLDYAALVLSGESWPPGVLGLVASQLVERYARPVLMITRDGDVARGSARSAAGVHLARSLTECRDMLLTFGGHEMAAGFSLPWPQVDAFRTAFSRHLRTQAPAGNTPRETLTDGRLSLEQAMTTGWEAVERLRPFGQGFRRPVWESPRVMLDSSTRFGRQQEHTRLHFLTSSGSKVEMIAWRMSEALIPGPVRLTYSMSADARDGQRRPQLVLSELIPIEEETDQSTTATDSGRRLIDLRTSADPVQAVSALLAEHPDWAIWSEGISSNSWTTLDRGGLTAVERLVLWSAPAEQRVLDEVLATAQPDVIAIVLREPDAVTASTVLRVVLAAARFARAQRDGAFPLPAVARRIGHTEAVVAAALAVLADVSIIEFIRTGVDVQIAQVRQTSADIPPDNSALSRLSRLLAEESAYRRFLRESGLHHFGR